MLNYPSATRALQRKFKIHLLVVQKITKNYGNKGRLLYDGRYAVLDSKAEETAQLKCFLLSKKNKLILTTDSIDLLPPLTDRSYRNKIFSKAKPLWQLLEYEPKADNAEVMVCPQNLTQLQDYVDRFQPSTAKLTISFMIGHHAKCPTFLWFENPLPSKQKPLANKKNPNNPIVAGPINYNINLWAYTRSDYSIG